jgi:hypothetical protein
MKLLYRGIDTLDFAVKGALSRETLTQFREVKPLAVQRQSAVLAEVGSGKIAVQVAEVGRRGGYAFTCHTGPLGAVYAFKDNPDPEQWNVFVSIRASTLAAFGYEGARDVVLRELINMGCAINEISIARIDYAMDFFAPEFVLDPARFIAHPHSKLKPAWSKSNVDTLPYPMPVFRGRRVESVTVGKMPGRQVIVYDKRYAAIQKRELFWFDVWQISKKDAKAGVWRVEVRAGKRELKDRWHVTTFQSLEVALGDIVREILLAIRYHSDAQTDSNVSRQRLDPLWLAATAAAEDDLHLFTSGLMPSRLIEIERDKAKATYEMQVCGNTAGLAACLNLSPESAASDLPDAVAGLLSKQLANPKSTLCRSLVRAREKLHFLALERDSVAT